MVSYYRPTRAEISLDALRSNIAAFRAVAPGSSRLLAAVKANAYGHGAVEIVREAEACGVDYFGVAFLDEAIHLRRSGITAPILVFGYVPAEGLGIARELNIAIALFREDILAAAAMLQPHSSALKVHIKVDTGMGRLGLTPEQNWRSFLERALHTPGVEVEGLFTHFSKADERDKAYTERQVRIFADMEEYVAKRGWHIPIIHAGNSAAGIDTPEWAGGMLRIGIGMYGLYPSEEVNRQRIALQPVMTLKTEVVMVKEAPANWGISYGARYVTPDRERIGTLPVGYADGYSRMLSGKAEVLLRGQRAAVLGTICMDQCMIALAAAERADIGMPAVTEGEEVVLFGRQGAACLTVDEVAKWLGTINYEVVCMLAARVPRIYLRGNEVAGVTNYLAEF
ncbi:alanine racemase [Paenibacillaceae bacterium]|nr:alanine racemase [Paenibacillaceae bacterium]